MGGGEYSFLRAGAAGTLAISSSIGQTFVIDHRPMAACASGVGAALAIGGVFSARSYLRGIPGTGRRFFFGI
jgi:hypothetical protein